MKYIFILLAALFLAFTASAQSVTWCPPGAEWYFKGHYQTFSGYSHIKYEGDTIMSGRNCKWLSEYFIGTDYFSGDTAEIFKNRFTYEQNGVVYGYSEMPAQEWDTLYNFNAVPGDSWTIKNGYGDYFYVQVTDTGSTVKQGYSLKWFSGWIGYADVVMYIDTVFERIGIAGDNMDVLRPLFTFGGSLCSYSDSSFTNWPNQDAACSILPPVSRPNELPEPTLVVYPNPASDKVTISMSNRNQENVNVELRDIFGKIVLQDRRSVDNKELEISLTGYLAGLYFLRMSDQNQSYTTKIIKQ